MAHVAANENGNTNLSQRIPFMDPMTHGVIKETSKSLRYYLDVKRRENAFVLSSSSSALNPVPLKARFIYGTTKEYPPLYGSFHSDNDVKTYLRSFQQQRHPHSTSISPEKQMCREELYFHMREQKYSPKEAQKFGESRLGPSNCSRSVSPDFRQRVPRSALKSSRRARNQLVDNTADILATMVKTRQSIYQANYFSQQVPPPYVSQNANPSPRPIDDPPHTQATAPSSTESKPKRPTKNPLDEAASIMFHVKPLKNKILCEYKVSVTTGNCNGASTNAPIRMKFYGINGYTNFSDLIDSETHRTPFLKGQTDVFFIKTDHVGKLAGITIGHDQKDIRSGWFLDKVSIYDPIREITSEILCNSWLSSKSHDKKTMRDFQVISTASRMKERREYDDDQSTSSAKTKSTSHTTNGSEDDHQRTKRHSKKQQVFTSSTTVPDKRTSIPEKANHHSQSPLPTTIESHFNQREFGSPPIPKRHTVSPSISPSSSDTEIEDHTGHRSHSTTPRRSSVDRHSSRTPDSTPNGFAKQHSIDQTRPPARLKNRESPVSPERPRKNQEEENEDDAFTFFE